jgi:hypothetical protein
MSGGFVGHQVGTAVGILPSPQVAATVNGPAIARPGSFTVFAMSGATTGTPTSFTVSMKVQDSDDGTSGWADVTNGALAVITTINTSAELNIGTLPKAFLRVVSVVAFVGGTAPTVQVAAMVITGGSSVYPV